MKSVILLAVMSALPTLPAAAGVLTLYTYTGNPYTSCLGTYDCNGATPYISVTFQTTLSSSQLDNLNGLDITPDVSSFSIWDGAAVFINSADPHYTDSFDISTDATGNITAWSITAATQENPSVFAHTISGPPPSGDGSGICTPGPNGNLCPNGGFNAGDSGIWSAPTQTPEPPGLLLLAAALILLAVTAHRQNELKRGWAPVPDIQGAVPEPGSLPLIGGTLIAIVLWGNGRLRPLLKAAGLAAAAMVAPFISFAGTITTVPPGLTPGSPYRLVFVTALNYDSEDHYIADYNAGVNNEANGVSALAALNATWTVIGSSILGVNAIDNIGQDPGVPIYNLAGLLVANDATTGTGGLFSGQLINAIDIDENGNGVANSAVFTGSNAAGTGTLPGPGSQLGQYWVEYGNSGSTSQSWSTNGYAYYGDFFPLYGISTTLTTPTPEPSSLALLGLALLLLLRRHHCSCPN